MSSVTSLEVFLNDFLLGRIKVKEDVQDEPCVRVLTSDEADNYEDDIFGDSMYEDPYRYLDGSDYFSDENRGDHWYMNEPHLCGDEDFVDEDFDFGLEYMGDFGWDLNKTFQLS